ncbi:MAG: fluoride efflux transporter CrcB [Pseudomonadota bacterium]
MSILASVAAGGALGAMGRYLVGHWATTSFGTAFPWGTLIVNVVGSFLIAVFAFAMIERGDSGPAMRAFAITGVLGGFTTFSAFSLDALSLFERGETGLAAAYVLASVLLSVGGCMLGFLIVRAVA